MAVSRHRIGTDGKGVTSLVGFFGCPLRCRYCLNPKCFDKDTKCEEYTPETLYEKLKIDDLYFRATDGGVTFGGGESLTNADFISKMREITKDNWKYNAETSLYITKENLLTAAECIDFFIVDIKDTNAGIYKSYTGKDNETVIENLSVLLKKAGPEKILVRLPLIKDFNSEKDREKSEQLLKKMGVKYFDKFTYRVKG